MRERDKAIMQAAGPEMARDFLKRETRELADEVAVIIGIAEANPEEFADEYGAEALEAMKGVLAAAEQAEAALKEWK